MTRIRFDGLAFASQPGRVRQAPHEIAAQLVARGSTPFKGPQRRPARERSTTSCDLSHFQVWSEGRKSPHETWEVPMHKTSTPSGVMVYIGFAAVLLMLYLM
jgi:hypothetical protein